MIWRFTLLELLLAFSARAVGGPVALCGPKGTSTYSTWLMADGGSAYIPLETASDCECKTLSFPIIIGWLSEKYDIAKLDENKSEGENPNQPTNK